MPLDRNLLVALCRAFQVTRLRHRLMGSQGNSQLLQGSGMLVDAGLACVDLGRWPGPTSIYEEKRRCTKMHPLKAALPPPE